MPKQVIDLSDYNINIGGYSTATSAVSLINILGEIDNGEAYVPTKPIERFKVPKASKMPTVLAGILALALLALMCINYLSLCNDIDTTVKGIARLEVQLSDIADENEEEYARIIKSVDLNEIERIAVDDLNMVPRDLAESVVYEQQQGEYTRQFTDFN